MELGRIQGKYAEISREPLSGAFWVSLASSDMYPKTIWVWYICLHLPFKKKPNVGKYTSPMDGMGINKWLIHANPKSFWVILIGKWCPFPHSIPCILYSLDLFYEIVPSEVLPEVRKKLFTFLAKPAEDHDFLTSLLVLGRTPTDCYIGLCF